MKQHRGKKQSNGDPNPNCHVGTSCNKKLKFSATEGRKKTVNRPPTSAAGKVKLDCGAGGENPAGENIKSKRGTQ